MKRLLAVLCLVGFLGAVPAQAYQVRWYNCDMSGGVLGFVQDYLVHNGSELITAILTFLPRPFRAPRKAPEADGILMFENTGFAASVLTVGAGMNTNVRLDVNAVLHFVCLEIAP